MAEQKNSDDIKAFMEYAALSFNDQEMANSLGINPRELKEKAVQREELPFTIGNVFTGWWSNNWQNGQDP